ncbi:LOW QUALITY PROTEIN: 39S ribosomal protein S30, mitochondrial [Thalassophryne amazonica]|uniref:LOW QUALITY PROTEIN: 39S ribosomal protein S30, mitochondrial n=1 Tax=Thalassophryne amazonica TaxID=390379 RepID=UPI0014709679|nr:LOW QUALITY PROTEIN: 39S ribosomal protein S30, mitochondrial [Thalassophryne amazonica]
MAACRRVSLQSLLFKNVSPFRHKNWVHTEGAVKEPVYPHILPSLTAKSKSALLRRIAGKGTKNSRCATEEKISLLTRKQRMKFVVQTQPFARNADRWYQHFTKTAYIPGLPQKFTAGTEKSGEEEEPAASAPSGPGIGDDVFADIRTMVIGALLQEQWHMTKRRPFVYRSQEHFVAPFLRNLVNGFTHSLARYNPLLPLCSVDLGVKVNFYWRRGQRIIPRGHRKRHQEPYRFQIDDCPHSQIRIISKLPQFTSLESSYTAEVPQITHEPNLMPLFRRQYDNNIFTGTKLADPVCYGHTQFHLVPDCHHRDTKIRRKESDQIEVFLRANGMASLFAWTGAQAMYQGFWDREDVNRPFVSQAVITDGQFFSFFCYQLNTVALSVEMDGSNPRKNLLWGTESLRLYEKVQDGEVVGLNDDVIKLLIQFLMNQP